MYKITDKKSETWNIINLTIGNNIP